MKAAEGYTSQVTSWFGHKTNEGRNLKFRHYDGICLGGTLDHLHSGHKLFLTQAALVVGKRMLIGVTGDELLKKKKFAEFLEDYEVRAKNVEKFYRRLCGDEIELNIF